MVADHHCPSFFSWFYGPKLNRFSVCDFYRNKMKLCCCARSTSERFHSSYSNLKIVARQVGGELAPCVVKGNSLCFRSWSPCLFHLTLGLWQREFHGFSWCRYLSAELPKPSSQTSSAALKPRGCCWSTLQGSAVGFDPEIDYRSISDFWKKELLLTVV